MKRIHLIPDANRIEESLELLKSVDGAFEYNDFWNPRLLDQEGFIEERIQLYQSLNRDCSEDTLHGCFLDIAIHSDDPRIREVSEYRVKQSMEIARRLGVRAVIFHTNIIANFQVDSYMDHWVERNQSFFRALANEYPEIEIYMENMFDSKPTLLRRLAENMLDVKNFGVCFDYAHANIFAEDSYEWKAAWFPSIRHVHVNDNDGKQDLHLPVGAGVADWKHYNELMRKMEESGNAPSVLIEVTSIEGQKLSISYMREHHIYPF